MRTSTTLLALAVAAAWNTIHVHAKPEFVAKIPNGDAIPGIAALGHVNHKGGGDLNSFGRAFQDAGFRWSTELCEADTDHDGQTNGQELGDPCCSWIETQNLAYIRGISDPNDPTSVVNPLIYKSIQCTKSEAAIEANNRKNKKATPKPKTRVTPAPANVYEGFYDSDSGSGGNDSSSSAKKPSLVSPSSSAAARATTTAVLCVTGITLTVALTLL